MVADHVGGYFLLCVDDSQPPPKTFFDPGKTLKFCHYNIVQRFDASQNIVSMNIHKRQTDWEQNSEINLRCMFNTTASEINYVAEKAADSIKCI